MTVRGTTLPLTGGPPSPQREKHASRRAAGEKCSSNALDDRRDALTPADHIVTRAVCLSDRSIERGPDEHRTGRPEGVTQSDPPAVAWRGRSSGERDLPLNQSRFSQRSPYVAFDPVEVRHLPQILTELCIPTALVVVDALLELLGKRGGVQPAMRRLLAK